MAFMTVNYGPTILENNKALLEKTAEEQLKKDDSLKIKAEDIVVKALEIMNNPSTKLSFWTNLKLAIGFINENEIVAVAIKEILKTSIESIEMKEK